MPERAAGAALLAVACVAVVATGVLLAPTEGCTLHNCDPSSSTIKSSQLLETQLAETPTGPMGSTTVLLQSSLYSDTWLPFPGNRTITVEYPSNFGNPVDWTIYVSTGPNQEEAGATATPASGQLAQLLNLTASGFQVQNGSCADYYIYFTVLGTAPPPLGTGTGATPAQDAGTDAPHD